MRKYYKVVALTLLMLMFLVSLSGCENLQSKNNNEIVVWCNLSNYEVLEVDAAAQQWAKETGKKVKVYTDKGDNRAFIEASKKNMQPDIEFGISHDRMDKLNHEKLLAELPKGFLDESKYTASSLETVTFNNKLYGVPISVETYALYYNKDKVKTPPETLEELISQGQKLGFQYDINNFYLSFPFVQVNGGYIFKKNNGKYDIKDIGLNSDGAVKGYSIVQDMVQKYKLMPDNIDGITARNKFKDGKIAFYLSASSDISDIDTSSVNYAVAKLPTYNGKQMSTFVSCKDAFVTSKSKDKKEVWDLFKYLIEKTPEPLFKTVGRLPALNLENTIPQVKNNDKEKMFVKQAEYGELIPNVTEIQALQDSSKTLMLLTSGKISPKECGNKIENSIKEFIKKEKQ
ncbi:maltose ABC transporter substrate-binding protein [Clostridium sp. DJ247]|uniref:sugar ABC transporter substrate-binding protein n=1 Tax=Clostridium sp. DJ247 TaxID=2726188 RepID=UPI00162ADAB0|nr:maltose ABC transporter substrate-binding protein [Clostridium sp. DJ247]MBC2580245.1 maltose ABC transporter substrate-binding protein [Clostridium sp. DJ247]